jgi:hypothetical protein
MKRLTCLCLGIITLLLLATPSGIAQTAQSNRVLFLGNSVFYWRGGVYQAFEGFCQADGLDYQAISQRKQPENPHGIDFLGYGRIPVNLPEMAADEKIHALIRNGQFDYVILEARRPGYLLPEWVRSVEPEDGESIPFEQNSVALGKLHRTIVESGAQTVLYIHPGDHRFPDWVHPFAQIYARLQADLEAMEINGQRHRVTLVPASLLWLDAKHRYGVDVWYDNSNHGSDLARYASGCLLYTYLTGNDPRKSEFRELPTDWNVSPDASKKYVSKDDAKWITEQAWLYYTTRSQ